MEYSPAHRDFSSSTYTTSRNCMCCVRKCAAIGPRLSSAGCRSPILLIWMRYAYAWYACPRSASGGLRRFLTPLRSLPSTSMHHRKILRRDPDAPRAEKSFQNSQQIQAKIQTKHPLKLVLCPKKLCDEFLDHGIALGQGRVECAGVFAAGFCHVGTAAAGTSNFLSDLGDDFSGLHTRSQVFGDADDERDLAVADGAKDDHSGANLVTKVIDECAQLGAVEVVSTCGQDFHAFHFAHVFDR